MTKKRTVPALLIATSLLGLLTAGCIYEPYHHRHRHYRLDLNAGAVATAPAEAAGR